MGQADTFPAAARESASLAMRYAQGLGDASAAVGDAEAAAGQAAQAEVKRVTFEDRVYPGVYSKPPTAKLHSGLPPEEGDRCVILIAGEPYEHLRSDGGWRVQNLLASDLAGPGGAQPVGIDFDPVEIFEAAMLDQGSEPRHVRPLLQTAVPSIRTMAIAIALGAKRVSVDSADDQNYDGRRCCAAGHASQCGGIANRGGRPEEHRGE